MLTALSVLGTLYVIGTVIWFAADIFNVPVPEDEHDECMKARDSDDLRD